MSIISQQSCHTYKITAVALTISGPLRVRDGWVSLGRMGPAEKQGKREGGSLRSQRPHTRPHVSWVKVMFSSACSIIQPRTRKQVSETFLTWQTRPQRQPLGTARGQVALIRPASRTLWAVLSTHSSSGTSQVPELVSGVPGLFPSNETQGTHQTEFPGSPRLCFFTHPRKNRKHSQLGSPTTICSRPGTGLALQLRGLLPHQNGSRGQANCQQAGRNPAFLPQALHPPRAAGERGRGFRPDPSASPFLPDKLFQI